MFLTLNNNLLPKQVGGYLTQTNFSEIRFCGWSSSWNLLQLNLIIRITNINKNKHNLSGPRNRPFSKFFKKRALSFKILGMSRHP